MSNDRFVHYRTCNLCEAMCGIEITVENGAVTSIRGDEKDEFSRGHICPKAVALQDLQTDPDRLKYPVRKTPTGWERMSWEDAFDFVADRLKAVRRQYGDDAVAVYQGNPTAHNYGSMMYGPMFVRALKTKNRFSATSVDQLPHHFAAYLMFGHQLLLPIPDIDRTRFFLIIGGNPVASNGSLMTAPDVANRIREIQKRGGTVVVVDPRRTETAAIADRHFFVRPGTDAFLVMALVHTIFEENLVKPGKLAEITDGFDAVQAIVKEFSPETVADTVGIAAAYIRKLARDFAAAESAIAYGRMGASTQEFGALCQWMLNVLNIVTGNLDRPGGMMFTRPAVDVLKSFGRGHYAKWKTRVRGLPEFGGELPVAALAEEIATPGPGQIKALVTSAGNPVLSTPNGGQLEKALEQLDFMVSIDYYLNETTRHADVILPPTTSLEHDNYDLIFHVLAVRNTVKYSPALFQPEPGQRHDWEIFLELAMRMETRDLRTGLAAAGRRIGFGVLGPAGLLDFALRTGPYGSGYNVLGDGLTLGKVKRSVHGIDLGPLKPALPKRLFTKNKRIALAPELLVKDVERLKRKLRVASSSEFPLLLIGRRHIRSNNSWMHNSERLVRGKDRCTLQINPEDAKRMQVADGQIVRVSSRVGAIDIPAEVTADLMPGVVSIPHGWGHTRQGIQLQVAQRHAGASINDLTDDTFIDALCGNAALSGVPVRIEVS